MSTSDPAPAAPAEGARGERARTEAPASGGAPGGGRRRGGRPGRAADGRREGDGRARRPRDTTRHPHRDDARLTRAAEARAAVDLPEITYPEQLPVSARREEIAAALRDHQVVVVAGETGSGKTTQIPKIALELGRGRAGQIGHTQPRRIAARSVAERIADELGVPLAASSGTRCGSPTSPATRPSSR